MNASPLIEQVCLRTTGGQSALPYIIEPAHNARSHQGRETSALAFDVGEFLGDFAVANAEDVDAADVPVTPGVTPAGGAAVAAGEQLFQLEVSRWGAAQKLRPEGTDGRLAGKPLAV